MVDANSVEEKTPPVKAGVYVRVSSDEQAERGTSLESQVAQCRAFAQVKDWHVAEVYADAGISGAMGDRPGLKALLKDAELGRFKVLVVARLDRMARKQLLLLNVVERLHAAGVDFVSVSESFDTSTPFGRAALGLLGTFAELERELIRDRTMKGRRARQAQGLWAAGAPPFGYVYDPTTKGLQVVEGEAVIVQRVFAL